MHDTQPVEIPARHGKALKLAKGQAVRLINTHGTQVKEVFAAPQTPELQQFVAGTGR